MSEEEASTEVERHRQAEPTDDSENDSSDETYQELEAAIKNMLKNTVCPCTAQSPTRTKQRNDLRSIT